MNTFSKADLDRIFLENCVLIGAHNVLPYNAAINIFGGALPIMRGDTAAAGQQAHILISGLPGTLPQTRRQFANI